ncbi:zinc finger protein RFP-like [Rhineura floridana]|uniref:zinc finger protein RFP-like n=1 Tax=Rhineura floridana TaxID=261503 RepID=UPI002AC7EB58|nr:zinc finger protein RFP-like [Rhineura floridana]
MASGGHIQGLSEEATCSICLDYFKNPMTIDCGHNFCQACLNQCWGESNTDPSCPQCRETIQQRIFRPNRQLANLVQLVKTLQEGKEEAASPFSKNDQTPIYVEYDRSRGHPARDVCPMEEASQQYKEKIKAYLRYLKKEREKLMNQQFSEEQGKQEYLTQLEMEKQKAGSAFERMQEFLVEKQHLWLSQLEDLGKEMEKKHEENLAKLSEEISQLNELIAEMEGKCLQPASEILQDIRDALSRCEKNLIEHVVDLFPRPEERLRVFTQKNSTLEKATENYKESLEQVLRADYLKQALNKANVTLDPDTAHPLLILSRDLNSVRRVQREQNLPDNPERFDMMPFVLGCERFTSGRHWWEVDVWRKATWAVGVATESVRKKGHIDINPHEGIWAMGKPPCYSPSPCQFLAFTSPRPTDLTLRREPRKIRVALDYEGGCVEFFDADTGEFIFTFHLGSFYGERIRPFLQVCCDVSLKC